MKAIKNLKQIKHFLKSQSDIGFAYLYDSALRGFFNRESDLDIAVYLKGKPANFFKRRLELCDRLSKIFGRETNVVEKQLARPAEPQEIFSVLFKKLTVINSFVIVKIEN